MNILYIIHRYLSIINTPAEERKKKFLPLHSAKRGVEIKTNKPKRFLDESEVVASYKFFEMLRIAKTQKK